MILYLTYDGLTDPLGQSQILPYIEGLANDNNQIHIVSFEKEKQYHLEKTTITKRLKNNINIIWHPLTYHANPKLLSTFYDLYILQKKCEEIIQNHNIKIVHCRSYPTATVGLKLKNKLGVKFIFDMRGFYIDERFDGRIWNKNNVIWKWLYPKMKKLELNMLNHADEVVSLTYNAVNEMRTWEGLTQHNFTIIPCAADLQHFKSEYQQEDTLNIVYLGSIGTWYLLDEMLRFFQLLNLKIPDSKFHFITKDNPEIILSAAKKINLDINTLEIYPSTREALPSLLGKMDLSIFFIKPSYSKKASSPTKLGELLSIGIPVICNTQVGDLQLQSNENPDSIIACELTDLSYDDIIKSVPNLLAIRKNNTDKVQAIARKYFSLEEGVKKYQSIYTRLFNSLGASHEV